MPPRASDAASRLGGAEGSVKGATNLEAARISDVVVLSVPFGAQTAVLTELSPQISGKIALSVVAPLAFVAGRARFAPPPTGSAAEEARLQVPARAGPPAFTPCPQAIFCVPVTRWMPTCCCVETTRTPNAAR